MKNRYLVVILTTEYLTDFLIIQEESPRKAVDVIQSLPKVLDVVSVWSEVEDET